MRSRLLILIFALLMAAMLPTATGQVDHVNVSGRHRTAAWDASLMVVTASGYGTGTLFKYKGVEMVLTSAHVVESEPAILVGPIGGQPTPAQVVYADFRNDIAILRPLVPVQGATPVRVRETRPDVGQAVFYVGHPNNNGKLLIEGTVAGHLQHITVLQSFTWMGASGSAVYDERGRIVGIVMGMDIASNSSPLMLPLEDLVFVVPIHLVDFEQLDVALTSVEAFAR